jgi:release factor glutamine methyltransferase
MKYANELEQIKQSGSTSPELDLRILLQLATGRSRELFIAHPEYELAPDEQQKLSQLVARRAQNEPIAHIMGYKEFYGRDFAVSRDVLTPRPETEHIIDEVKKLWPSSTPLKILDLGTGSGCILLTLLQEFPNSTGLGVDISNNALAIARQNAYKQGVGNAEFICSSWTKEVKNKQFDLIVSNPPYVESASTKLNLETKFEPQIALFAGEDGLDAYRQIASELKSFGFKYAIFEFGQGQLEGLSTIFKNNGFSALTVVPDYAGIDRLLIVKGQYE